MPAPYRRIGRILKPHGTHGEVTLSVRDGITAEMLEGIDLWLVPPTPRGARALRVSSVREGAKGFIVRFDVADDAHGAGDMAGAWVLARDEDVPPPEAAEPDLLGSDVVDEQRGLLGTLTDVIHTGANDVLVVDDGPFGQVLVPVIDDVVIHVDVAARRIDVRLLEGLIEEDDR
ncbi:MAG: 16S rRNA processing protein RimM [Coriobacteriia bacterium]|nr:16S rRNA processing protein RimM [Coriobacteriia bacterium]